MSIKQPLKVGEEGAVNCPTCTPASYALLGDPQQSAGSKSGSGSTDCNFGFSAPNPHVAANVAVLMGKEFVDSGRDAKVAIINKLAKSELGNTIAADLASSVLLHRLRGVARLLEYSTPWAMMVNRAKQHIAPNSPRPELVAWFFVANRFWTESQVLNTTRRSSAGARGVGQVVKSFSENHIRANPKLGLVLDVEGPSLQNWYDALSLSMMFFIEFTAPTISRVPFMLLDILRSRPEPLRRGVVMLFRYHNGYYDEPYDVGNAISKAAKSGSPLTRAQISARRALPANVAHAHLLRTEALYFCKAFDNWNKGLPALVDRAEYVKAVRAVPPTQKIVSLLAELYSESAKA